MALFPGGFGTMDEAFELLTLTQTGKSDMHPIVLLDAPGGTYWHNFVEFAKRDLVETGYVSAPDLNLFTLTDDVETAAKEIATFYTNYESMRFVGNRPLEELAALKDRLARRVGFGGGRRHRSESRRGHPCERERPVFPHRDLLVRQSHIQKCHQRQRL